MANERALTLDAAKKVVAQVDDGDILLVGAGISSNTGSITIGPAADGPSSIQFLTSLSAAVAAFDTTNRRMKIGDAAAPTARLHIVAGTAAVNTAPLKLTSGTLLTAPEAGSLEFNGTWYLTDGSGTRNPISVGSALTGYTNGATTFNTALGIGAGVAPPTGTYNTVAGYNAGNVLSTGSRNTLFGSLAGDALLTTNDNTCLGYSAGGALTGVAAINNVMIGSNAGLAATGTGSNVVIGYNAGQKFTSNLSLAVIIGQEAAYNVTGNGAGTGVIAIGYRAMYGNATTCSVPTGIAIGNSALLALNSSGGNGGRNLAIGDSAGAAILNSSSNTLVGFGAGGNSALGNYNTAVGDQSLQTATAGVAQTTSVGAFAMSSATGNQGVAVGYAALQTATGAGNIGLGYNAGNTITSGTYCIVIGHSASVAAAANDRSIVIGYGATGKGSDTVVIGRSTATATTDTWLRGTTLHIGNEAAGNVTLLFETTDQATRPGFRWNGTAMQLSNGGGAWSNIAAGAALTGYTDSASPFSTAVGSGAGVVHDAGGLYNTYAGFNAGNVLTTGDNNTLLGGLAGYNMTTAGNNTAVGMESLKTGSGSNNVAVGFEALQDYSTAAECVAVGSQAGWTQNGLAGTWVGYRAGANAAAPGTTGVYNCAFGRQSLFTVSSGSNNVALGKDAASRISTGSGNTAVGNDAMGNIGGTTQTSNGNTAIGFSSLNRVETGTFNVAAGQEALYAVVGGSYNVGVGYQAGNIVSSGVSNVAIGNETLQGVTTQSYNVAVGYRAARTATSAGIVAIGQALNSTSGTHGGPNDVAIGTGAGYQIGTSGYNVLVGYSAGYGDATPSTATFNVAVGFQCLFGLSSGTYNTCLGSDAGYSITTGSNNVLLGISAGRGISTSSYSVELGYQAGYRIGTGDSNVFVGYQAGYGNATPGAAAQNVAIGYQSLLNVSSGTNNACLGTSSGRSLTSGSTNTAVGYYSLYNATGTENTALGGQAGQKITTGNYNTALGGWALGGGTGAATGNYNVAVGYTAMSGTSTISGSDNIAVGRSSLSALTSGAGSVAVGYLALSAASTPNYNSALGYSSGSGITTGANNIAVGYNALSGGTLTGNYNTVVGDAAMSAAGTAAATGNTCIGTNTGRAITSGSYNTFIGWYAGWNVELVTTGTSNVAIGDGSSVGATLSDAVAIGHGAHATTTNGNIQLGAGTNSSATRDLQIGATGAGTTYNARCAAWNLYSDERIKTNIEPLGEREGLRFIERLVPVKFNFKEYDGEFFGRQRFGLIAQWVKKVMVEEGMPPSAVYQEARDEKANEPGDTWSLDYSMLLSPLMKAVQELSSMVKELQAEVAALKAR